MVATLIVAQGELADAILRSARTIVGETPATEALSVAWDAEPEDIVLQVRQGVERLDQGDGVLILTDMHGGSPDQAARRLVGERRVAVLAGVNLPMVVRLACCRPDDMSLEQLAAWIEAKGKRAICGQEGAAVAATPECGGR
ncbi:MAG: PTS sugar transporter subunit IIA [Thermoanaerobaculia bacterium]